MLGTRRGRGFGPAALLALATALLALAACQLVAGIQDRTADPEHPGCALPSGPGPQVRIANFAPTTDVVDVCIRAVGASWGEPLILNGGTGCTGSGYFKGASTAGFAYGQVSVPFTAPAPKVDVKAVAAGGSCSAPALAEADGLQLDAHAVTTLLHIGGAAGVARKIEALPENYPPNATNTEIRFVHAMPGVGPLDIGLGPSGIQSLPTTLAQLVLPEPVPYGGVPRAGELGLTGNTVTPAGYELIIAGNYNLVEAVHGSNPPKAVLLLDLQNMNGAAYTLYAAGLPRNDQFPQRGYFCPETTNSVNGTQSNPLVVQCQATGLAGISVDVLNTSLYGPNSPEFVAREQAITSGQTSPIQQRDSDLMCLVEVDFASDIRKIIANASPPDAGGTGSFPYSYWVQTAVSTPFTNPATQDGSIPPPPTVPPCGGKVPPDEVNKAYTCMIQNCSTRPGDATGSLPGSTDCLSGACAPQLGALLFGGYDACFDCIIDYAASDQPYADGQKACIDTVQQPFGFGGQLPNVILSRYPLSDSDAFILPSTNYRQGVLFSRVHLEDQTVDFYCGFLTSTLVASEVPYTGNYGAGGSATSETTGGAYANEQLLQAQDLIQWVKQKSGSNPAIIVGDWRSSLGVPDAGAAPPGSGPFTPPSSIVPETIEALSGAFTAVSASDWVPQCTYCPQSDNVLNIGQSVGYFMTQPFLANWPSASLAVQEESLLYTQPSPGVPLPEGGTGPISQYFGLNIQIIRPKM